MRTFLRISGICLLLLTLAGKASAVSDFPDIGKPGQFFPGKFIWFDLVTDDLDTEKKFYSAVFDWQFRALDDAPGDYTVIEHADRIIGGVFLHPVAEKRSQARWLSLISVTDPGQVSRYVEESGGSVIVPPANFAGRGTHALFRDPQGAVFGVLESASGDPDDSPVEDGDFFWLDLLTTDPVGSVAFYQGLAGYESGIRELGEGIERAVLSSGGFARAGVAPMPASVQHPGWLPYILVEDIAGTLDRVRAAGGRVLVEPRDNLLDGELAIIADPRDGVVGIVNWLAEPEEEDGQ